MSDRKTPSIRAAGGVVWQIRDGVLQVALVHRPRYDDWSLPKGKLERGESELTAAVREIGEELGSRVAVSRRLQSVTYKVGADLKSVAFWTMHHVGGEFAANDEVDEVAWLPPAEAAEWLTYEVERGVLADFTAAPVADSVVVLLRHAKAGKRSEWRGNDALRPLDRAGRAQARRLSALLDAFGPDRIVSAQPLRCRQTVAPLAQRLGLQVAVEPAFDDEVFQVSPDTAENALLALAKPRRVSVVCSQGTAIPGLIERALPIISGPDTRKGAAWVLSFVDGAAVSADYYEDAR